MGYYEDIMNQTSDISQGMGLTEGGVLKALADRANQLGATERMFMEEMKFKKQMLNREYDRKEEEANRTHLLTLFSTIGNLINPKSGFGEKLWGKPSVSPTPEQIAQAGLIQNMDEATRNAYFAKGGTKMSDLLQNKPAEPGLLPTMAGGVNDWWTNIFKQTPTTPTVSPSGESNFLPNPTDWGGLLNRLLNRK